MADFVFISPSVKFNERDLTVVNTALGITTAGLIGETTKGPAFEPIFIQNKTQMGNRFGFRSKEKIGSNLKFLLPYYADSYLNQSNQLFVTRVLGLSGYQAGRGWAVKISAAIDPSTEVNTTSSTGATTFSGGVFSGNTVSAVANVLNIVQPTFTKVGTSFSGIKLSYIVNTFASTPAGLSGTVSYTATTVTGTSYSQYENMVVAIIRTRGLYVGNTLTYNASAMTINVSGATTNPYNAFTLTSVGAINETYSVSLNPDSTNFVSKVLGSSPKDKNNNVFVEATYPSLIKKLVDAGYAYGVSSELIRLENCVSANFGVGYQTPETPWVVSELRGSTIERLFKFISISDGDSANQEIKISIQNIIPETGEFDVLIRDFNDTDDSMVILESFVRCTMNVTDNTFVGRRIGDYGENFEQVSNFVFLEFVDIDNISADAFPAGFEGYNFRSFASTQTCGEIGQTPKIFYNQSYETTDKVARTYLGITERGYDLSTSKGTSLSQNLFNFYGSLSSSGISKSHGFHMDSGATGTYTDGNYSIGSFDVGVDEFRTVLDTNNSSNAYFAKNTRKFTLVPYSGFDGWDIYRDERTIGNSFKTGGIYGSSTSDYNAYLQAINTFSNPEEVTINILSTPGINWSDQSSLVDEVIDMVETERMDCLYVIDAPNLDSPDASTYSQDVADLMDGTDIDSSYCATYGPWIQIFDNQNNINVFIPPTGEVLKSIALTDNSAFPWFAPAGLTRGLLNAKKAKYKLTEPMRDRLYQSRINPIADFSNVGVDIFGQKTLQIKDSALNRINVRRLLLYLRKVIANISVTLLFDQDDDTVVNEFLNKVTPILDNIKRERGLFNYKIEYQSINDSASRDRGELYFNLFLQPIKSLEFIGVTFSITPSGVNFQNI